MEQLRLPMKFDEGKARWDLLPFEDIEDIVDVLTHGSNKYGDSNWKLVVSSPGGKERYFSAAMRHLCSWRLGNKLDRESGLRHLAQAVTNILFLMWNDRIGETENK